MTTPMEPNDFTRGLTRYLNQLADVVEADPVELHFRFIRTMEGIRIDCKVNPGPMTNSWSHMTHEDTVNDAAHACAEEVRYQLLWAKVV